MNVFRIGHRLSGRAAVIIAGFCIAALSTVAGRAAVSSQAQPVFGTIIGTVQIEGKVPEFPPPKITKDADVCKDVPNEKLIVSPLGGVQNAVVALEGVPYHTSLPQASLQPVFRMTNSGCRFVPHVTVMQLNDPLEISNTDPILHTARAVQSQVNVGLYPGRTVQGKVGRPTTGPVKIICEIHPWMVGYVYLTDNPYYALTDVHGNFEIDNVPPGRYRLKVWHETLGTQVVSVDVTVGKTAEINFKLASGQPKPQ